MASIVQGEGVEETLGEVSPHAVMLVGSVRCSSQSLATSAFDSFLRIQNVRVVLSCLSCSLLLFSPCCCVCRCCLFC